MNKNSLKFLAEDDMLKDKIIQSIYDACLAHDKTKRSNGWTTLSFRELRRNSLNDIDQGIDCILEQLYGLLQKNVLLSKRRIANIPDLFRYMSKNGALKINDRV